MKKLKTYRLRFLIMLALLAVVAVGYFTALRSCCWCVSC